MLFKILGKLNLELEPSRSAILIPPCTYTYMAYLLFLEDVRIRDVYGVNFKVTRLTCIPMPVRPYECLRRSKWDNGAGEQIFQCDMFEEILRPEAWGWELIQFSQGTDAQTANFARAFPRSNSQCTRFTPKFTFRTDIIFDNDHPKYTCPLLVWLSYGSSFRHIDNRVWRTYKSYEI